MTEAKVAASRAAERICKACFGGMLARNAGYTEQITGIIAAEFTDHDAALAAAVREQLVKRVKELITHREWNDRSVFENWVANGGLEVELRTLPMPDPPEAGRRT